MNFLSQINTAQLIQIAGRFLQRILQSVSVFGLMMLIIFFLVIEAADLS